MSSKKVLPKGRRYAEQQKEQAERDHGRTGNADGDADQA